MLPNLANHSVKGFEGGEKVGLKLARTKSADVFWRTAFSLSDREPA
jgi:hypothetical protein